MEIDRGAIDLFSSYKESLNINSNIDLLRNSGFLEKSDEKYLRSIYLRRYCEEDWEYKVAICRDIIVDTHKIVGTAHPRYSNNNLFDAYNKLKRANTTINLLVENLDYYKKNTNRTSNLKELSLYYKQHKDEYYIVGNGNHRFLTAKAIGLKEVLVNKITVLDENYFLKELLLKLQSFKFDYDIEGENMVINSSEVRIRLYSYYNKLEDFLFLYEKVNTSLLAKLSYKFKLRFYTDYKNVYAYCNNEMKHIFHYNQERFIKHKEKYQIK